MRANRIELAILKLARERAKFGGRNVGSRDATPDLEWSRQKMRATNEDCEQPDHTHFRRALGAPRRKEGVHSEISK